MDLIENYNQKTYIKDIQFQIQELKQKIPKIINNNLLAGKYDKILLKNGLGELLIYLFMTIEKYTIQTDEENNTTIDFDLNNNEIINYFDLFFEEQSTEAKKIFYNFISDYYTNDLCFFLDNVQIIDLDTQFDGWTFWDEYSIKDDCIEALKYYLPIFIKKNIKILIKESDIFYSLNKKEKNNDDNTYGS